MSDASAILALETLPLFPLSGVALLPHGRVPLNVFEPRYKAMVEYALARKRCIGMIQPNGQMGERAMPRLFQVGCAGQIQAFNQTEDGRFLITLYGISRFKLLEELPMQQGFRQARVCFKEFANDVTLQPNLLIDRNKLLRHMRAYFKLQGLAGDWEGIEKTDNHRLIIALAMICPFQPNEKQALLEAKTMEECCRLLTLLMDMAVLSQENDEEGGIRH